MAYGLSLKPAAWLKCLGRTWPGLAWPGLSLGLSLSWTERAGWAGLFGLG